MIRLTFEPLQLHFTDTILPKLGITSPMFFGMLWALASL